MPYEADEKGEVHTLIACLGTEAKDSEVLEEAYSDGFGVEQAQRVLKLYKETSTKLLEWLKEELD